MTSEHDQILCKLSPRSVARGKVFHESPYYSSKLLRDDESHSYVIQKEIFKKSFSPSEINDIRKYIDGVNSINAPCFAKFKIVLEDESKIVLQRQFYEGICLRDYVAKITVRDSNYMFVIWKIIVTIFDRLHKISIFPNFFKLTNVILSGANEVMFVDLYLPPNPSTTRSMKPNIDEYKFYAPEFFSPGFTPSPASDYWTLGILLYFLMSNKFPFKITNILQMITQITSGNFKIEDPENLLPGGILEGIRDMIRINPQERASYSAVFTRIQQYSKMKKSQGRQRHSVHHRATPPPTNQTISNLLTLANERKVNYHHVPNVRTTPVVGLPPLHN